ADAGGAATGPQAAEAERATQHGSPRPHRPGWATQPRAPLFLPPMRSGTGAPGGDSYLPRGASGAKGQLDRETATIGRLGTDDQAPAASLHTQLGGREASSGQSLGVALSVRRGSHRGGPQRDPSPPA